VPEQLSDSHDELWSLEMVQHVERIKTVQSTLVCVCVCVCVYVSQGCTHKMSRGYQVSQSEHGAFSTACLGAQNPLESLSTLLYDGHCGGSEEAART